MFKYHRGDQMRDLITGFTGAVTSRCDSITGCNQYYLNPPVDKDGKLVDGAWFDEHRLQYDPAKLGQKIELERAHGEPPG